MSVTLNSTGITYSDGTSESTRSIPSGANVVFFMAAAPTNWTQITSHNDKALRVVSGVGGGSGGGVAFSTALVSTAVSGSIGSTTDSGTVGGTALDVTQIPAHNHTATVTDPGHKHTDSGHTHTTPQGFVSPGSNGITSGGSILGSGSGTGFANLSNNTTGITVSISNNGSGNTHTHSLTMGSHNHTFTGNALNVNYIDLILCTRN